MRILLALALVILVAGCNKGQPESEPADDLAFAKQKAPAAPADLEIWFEPVLQIPMQEFARKANRDLGLNIKLKGVGRADLQEAAQAGTLEHPPAIFIFAGQDTLVGLKQAGLIDETSARTIAGDRLALVQVKDRGYETHSLFDVYKLRFDAIGMARRSSALGYYTDQALISSGTKKRIEDKLVEFNSMMQLLEALRQDEVQMAIIPSSIVVQSTDLDPLLIIGEDLHEDIRYQAVAATGSAPDKNTVTVLALLAEDEETQQLFIGLGLVDRETAMVEDR